MLFEGVSWYHDEVVDEGEIAIDGETKVIEEAACPHFDAIAFLFFTEIICQLNEMFRVIFSVL